MAMSRSLGGTSLTTRSPIMMRPSRDFLQTGQQAQAGRLATTGRADEDEELLVSNLDVEVVHGDDIAETLVDMLESYTGHRVILLLITLAGRAQVASAPRQAHAISRSRQNYSVERTAP